MSILDQIVADKRIEIGERKKAVPLEKLISMAQGRKGPPDFIQKMKATPMGLIAEVKRRSPSAGIIREPFNPAAIAAAYEQAGAQAVSVLMDGKYFGGGEDDFRNARAAVGLPLLYKEFIVDPWQIWHAASLGASAALLIAAVLDSDELARFMACCDEARLAALVEVRDEAEMKKVSALNAQCVGINNRDLKTFKVSLETTMRVKPHAPAGCLLISESGIRSADDVARLKAAGIHGILVGEHLLRQPDLSHAVRSLMAGVWKV